MLFSLHTENRSFFIENPILTDGEPRMNRQKFGNMILVTPYLPLDCSAFERKETFIRVIRDLIHSENIQNYTFASSTCRSVPYLRQLSPRKVVYQQNDDEAWSYPELFQEMCEYADGDTQETEHQGIMFSPLRIYPGLLSIET